MSRFGKVVTVAFILLATPAIALVPSAASFSRAQPSVGFATAEPTQSARVTCAVGLQTHAATLYCASPAIKRGAYDGRGVVRLTPRRPAHVVVAGSDLLNAIDGNIDQTSPRPVLAPGKTWARSGYRCLRRRGSVTCRWNGHGFTLSAARLLATY